MTAIVGSSRQEMTREEYQVLKKNKMDLLSIYRKCDDTGICCKKLAVKFTCQMYNTNANKIEEYCRKKDIQFTITTDGHLIMEGRNKIQLKNGLQSLAAQMEIIPFEDRAPFERVYMANPAPDTLLQKIFPHGVDSSKIIRRAGEKFSDMAINKLCKIELTKTENARIDECKDAKEALDKGLITFGQHNIIQAAKNAIAEAQKNKDFENKPDLIGEYTLRFAHYPDGEDSKVEGTEIEVKIYGFSLIWPDEEGTHVIRFGVLNN